MAADPPEPPADGNSAERASAEAQVGTTEVGTSSTSGGTAAKATIDNEFERAKAAFEQNGDSFRSLNQLMWQVPLIAMTLTGGLWYAVFNAATPTIARVGLLLLAAIADLGLGMLVLPRVRNVMEAQLKKMREFYEPGHAKPEDLPHWKYFGSSRGTINVYRALLVIAAIMSAVAMVLVLAGAMEPPGATSSAPPIVTTTTTTTSAGVTTTITTTGPATGAGPGPDAPFDARVDGPLSDSPATMDAWSPPLDSTTPISADDAPPPLPPGSP